MLTRPTNRPGLLALAVLASVLPTCHHSPETQAPPHVSSASVVGLPPISAGATIIDDYPRGELTVSGTCSESYLATHGSGGGAQAISEGLALSGHDGRPRSSLDHRWLLRVAGGQRVELHVAAHRHPSLDGDDFAFELSSDGGRSWVPIPLPDLPLAPEAAALVAPLPDSLAGEILVRVVDTGQEAGLLVYDTVYVDEIFVRSTS